jgi:asparagine synthase (glutamine-hydrolysing)
MCGIAGIVDFNGARDAGAIVRRMTATMVHRGPDDEGYLDDGPIALGMRRLSIIDLEGGHQPIFNEDESIAVVLNGEIYNFRELRSELESLGHVFRTRSDSEVIAHGYEEWGDDCVRHFEGMFAIAVYDRKSEVRGRKSEVRSQKSEVRNQELGVRSHRLFLARDRLGMKPLYYYAGVSDLEETHHGETEHTENAGRNPQSAIRNPQFLFASEVRTLLASGVVPKRLSRAALHSYLLFGSVSEPMTLVEGVLSLPPGHTLAIDLDAEVSSIKPQPYWSIANGDQKSEVRSQKSEIRGQRSEVRDRMSEVNVGTPTSYRFPLTSPALRSSPAARVRQLLVDSVRKHLIADVPIGIFLSSGIDSTSIAALASREAGAVHTFTVAFEETEFNEAAMARRTATKLGTKHDELLLKSSEMLARLDEAIGALDQPSMDGINTYFVSAAARQAGLKVALSGLGGDEIFGGYKSTFGWTPRYQRIAAVSSRVPEAVRTAMAFAASTAGENLNRGDAGRKIAALWNDSRSLPHPYFFARALFAPSQVSGLLNRAETNGQALWWHWLSESVEQTRGLDSFAAVSCLEARSYLVNTLLRDTDSMSMAHSLEVRVPFLDHPLVEFVAQLPQEIKIGNGNPKGLLVDALADLLPAEVTAQTKRGFTFPWAEWLRGPLREKVETGLSSLSSLLREALNEGEVRRVWQSYLRGKTSWSRPWSLYVLNEWVKRNLE